MEDFATTAAAPPGAPAKPSTLKTWWLAVRPFSFPASTMPVVFGTALAVSVGRADVNVILFFAALIGIVVLHSAANLLNDVYDFKKGIDQQVNPVSGAVVRGWITPRQGLVAAWLLLAVGVAVGLVIVSLVGVPVLWIGLVGVAIGVFYTWGPSELKYHALGDFAVFANFGVLGALGAWTVQTGRLSWVPAVWAIPIASLVAAILHANNWRDIRTDAARGVRTMANILGDRGSLYYYAVLIFGPFAFVVAYLLLSRFGGVGVPMPWSFLVVLLALPLAAKLMKKGVNRHAPAHPADFVALDGATAQLNLVFGLLCTTALGIDAFVGWVAR